MSFDRLGKKGTPWHFWEDKHMLTGVPRKPVKKNIKFAVTQLVLTQVVPFRMPVLTIIVIIIMFIIISSSSNSIVTVYC